MTARSEPSKSLIGSASSNLLHHLQVPDNVSTADVLLTSIVLIGGLVLVVPILSLVTRLSLVVLVPLFGLCYGCWIIYTDRAFAGFVSGFFALSVFNANVPLVAGPGISHASVFIVDPIAIGLLVVVLIDRTSTFDDLTVDPYLVSASVCLAFFVCWSFISAAAGNGPSRAAAVMFAIEQTRYLLLFVVAALVVHRTTIWHGLYPLMISIGGNLLFATFEILNGNSFGLTILGEKPGKMLSAFVIGGVTVPTGYYPGGFVGHGRELLGLLLLLAPFLIFWAVHQRWIVTGIASLGIIGCSLVIRITDTDAGWMAFVLVLLGLTGVTLSRYLIDSDRRNLRGLFVAVVGLATSVFLFSRRAAEFATESRESSTNTGSVTSGSGGEGVSQGVTLLDIASWVPFVQSDTLSIRLTQYSAAIDIASQYPLFGIGGQNFILISESYGLPASMGIHNTFFSHLAATGVVGALAYTVSVVTVVIVVIRRIVRTTGSERLLWGCIVIGLMGFHAYSFWTMIYSWLAPNAGLWILSGIVIGGSLSVMNH